MRRGANHHRDYDDYNRAANLSFPIRILVLHDRNDHDHHNDHDGAAAGDHDEPLASRLRVSGPPVGKRKMRHHHDNDHDNDHDDAAADDHDYDGHDHDASWGYRDADYHNDCGGWFWRVCGHQWRYERYPQVG